FVEQHLMDTISPTPQSGLVSTSGDSTATGMHSAIAQANTQLAACSDAGMLCAARNVASLRSAVQDLPTNLALPPGSQRPGGTTATSGDALVNATPTPIPSTSSNPAGEFGPPSASNGPEHRSGGRAMHNSEQQELAVELTASGHVVIVDLWGQWPGRRLPPMPDPVAQTTYSSRVSASLDPWPSISELPLPGM